MGFRIQYWVSTGLAGLLLVLVVANIWFYEGNVERQVDVNNRQAFIQQAAQLEGLNREIIQALASLSVGNADKPGDKQIEQMLGILGIKVNPAPANPAQQASQPAVVKQKKL
jgi:hypothetical protein